MQCENVERETKCMLLYKLVHELIRHAGEENTLWARGYSEWLQREHFVRGAKSHGTWAKEQRDAA